MKRSAVTLKNVASFFACSLLMERLPFKTSEKRPRMTKIGSRSLVVRPLVSIRYPDRKSRRVLFRSGELLCLLLADGTLAVQDLGKTATHDKDWQQVLGCPAAGFHQVSQHLVRRHRWQRVVAVVMGLGQNSHGFQQCRVLRGWAANDPIRLWK